MSVSRSGLIWSAVNEVPEPPGAAEDDAVESVEAAVDAADVGAPVVVPVNAADVLFALVPVAEEPATVPELLQAAEAKMTPVTAPMAALLTPNPIPIPHFDEMRALRS